ncbi:hypothetical protein J4E85_010867 [Alternaria conjuncta]|uniref:uncharacterized protein n=1 Tax=Alternaria conjuncta TaxID=181017 RepID=UPI002220CA18|nr:uncharacterized protein J4E85_010867 [Alternaria conjuncta]KAI4913134.1 hypothetical protein J4E85_010867 [Alternaria conjuncta]
MSTSPNTDGTTPSSKPEMLHQEHKQPDRKIGLRSRLKHFTFAWFLSTMSTGGLALAIAETPHQFPGLHQIGLTLFILNIALFLLLCTCTALRFLYHTSHFLTSFLHPSESFFAGSFYLSLSVILAGIQTYGITHGPAYPWLIDAVYLLYWIYAGASLANSVFQYWIVIQRGKGIRPC